MNDTHFTQPEPAGPVPGTCARCGNTLGEGDRVAAGDREFCRSCYAALQAELSQVVTNMTRDVNYPLAVVGAVLGGALGVLVWWGFTVLTKVAFGLVAIVIGYLVGHGAVRLAGGKRGAGLQAVSVAVALASFLVATYLVNMSFINQVMAEQGDARRLGFPPAGVGQFGTVVALNFGVMDVVFLAIVVWKAWSIPRAPRLAGAATP